MTTMKSGAGWQVYPTTSVPYLAREPAPDLDTSLGTLSSNQSAISPVESSTSLPGSSASGTQSSEDSAHTPEGSTLNTPSSSSSASAALPPGSTTPSESHSEQTTVTTPATAANQASSPSTTISSPSSTGTDPLTVTLMSTVTTPVPYAQNSLSLSVSFLTSTVGTLSFGDSSDPGSTGMGGAGVPISWTPRTSRTSQTPPTSTTTATTGLPTDIDSQPLPLSQKVVTGSVVGGVLASVLAAVVFFLVWRQRRLGNESRKPWPHFLRRLVRLPHDIGASMLRDPESAPNTVPVPWTSPYPQGILSPYQDHGRPVKADRLRCFITRQWRAMNPTAASSLERITQLTSELETEVGELNRATRLETEVEVLNRTTRLEVRPNENGHLNPLSLESPVLSPINTRSNTALSSPATSSSDLSYASQQQQLLNIQTNIVGWGHGPRETPPPLYRE